MKYPYRVLYTEVGPELVPVMQLPEGFELVTSFLLSDVQGPLGDALFLDEINRVLRGETTYSEVGGNVCALLIRPDFTTVIDTLADDEEDPQNRCLIETEELKELILAWLPLHPLDANSSSDRERVTIARAWPDGTIVEVLSDGTERPLPERPSLAEIL